MTTNTSILATEGLGADVRTHCTRQYTVAVKAIRAFNEALDGMTAQQQQQFAILNRHSDTLADTAMTMFGHQVSMFEAL